MFKRTMLSRSLLIAFSGNAALCASAVFAQDQTDPSVQQLQRVEITGSAIRRSQTETALPVVVLRKEDIERSGATSTVDLLKRVTAVQGSTGESASVGGSTFGFSGVSVHNLGEARTLVLLNGRRLTLFGGQTLTGFAAGFDLNSIPIASIERVEVLTDGASALYGADAVAGVVNFITKHDTTEGDISVGVSDPKGGAREKRASISKGFGSLDADGYNGYISFGHDERTALASTARSFAKSGQIRFSANGKNYQISNGAASAIPANVTDDNGQLISPYQKTTGSCPPKSFRITDSDNDDYCGFDYVSTLQIYPVRKRDSLYGSFDKMIAGQDVYINILASQTKQTSNIAPVPGSLTIPAGSALANQYLLPLGITQDSLAYYRVADLGPRASHDTSKFFDIVIGSKGQAAGWDYDAALTRSRSDVKSNISGYPGALALTAVRQSGLLDPFVLPGQQSAAAQAALNAINYNGYWDGGTSTLTTADVHASKSIYNLPAGELMLAAGVNFNKEQFQSKPSLYAQGLLADPVLGTLCNGTTLPCDQRFGDSSLTIPYAADRKSYGIFSELSIPVLKTLEFNLGARYDHFSDFGQAYTGQGSFKWTPAPNLLIRGSAGTGFHAPTVPQVNAVLQPYGVTSNKYSCTPDLQAEATAQGAVCRAGSQQYDQKAGGSKTLQPEKSRQATLGIRYEPINEISLGADLWHVEIRDAFGQLPEQAVFANPLAFPNSWGSNLDIATGKNYLAFVATNANLGKIFSTGIDFDISGRAKTPVGSVNSQLTMTYMLRESQQLAANGAYYTAIGQNSADLGTVTFRWQGRWATSVTTGDWVNTLAVNYKSGYRDHTEADTPADILDSSGAVIGSEAVSIKVPSYTTFDLQTMWNFRKDMSLTLGLLNMFDRSPPLSISIAGTNRGQQFGYDDRYYDPRGRTIYANFSYKF